MTNKNHESMAEEALINQLHKFVECHLEYNKDRTHTSTEKAVLERARNFSEQHPSISLERSEEINPKTFCAHGTNAWALFSACAFSNGQLLSRNALKLVGLVPISGESKGLSIENRNFISTVELVGRSATLNGTTKYSIGSTNTCIYLRKNLYEYLRNKFLKKYEKRHTNRSLKDSFQSIFDHSSMQAACDRLSKIPIVIVGDGIGDSGFTFSGSFSFIRTGAGREPGEILYKKLNIRAVIVSEADKVFVQKLIQTINPELEKTIAFLTTEEVKKFESARQSQDEAHRRPYIIDFLDVFNEVKTILKVAFSAMRPVRLDEDVLGKRYPKSWDNDPNAPPVIRFEAGETVYYEQCLEKTPAQVVEDICNEALQASIEVIRVIRTLAKYEYYVAECNRKSIDGYFKEHRRFWNYELDLYQYLHGASTNNLIDKIETVRSFFCIVKEEIEFAYNLGYIRETIRQYRDQCLNKEDTSSAQVASLKIMDLLESVIGKIIFINDRKIVHYEKSVKENKVLKLAEEWMFIRELIRKYREYRQKGLNSQDNLNRAESLEKIINGGVYLNGNKIGCDGESLRKDLEELIKNISHETSQYYNSIITLLQDLKKRDDYSIKNYRSEVNFIMSVFDSELFKNHLPLYLVDSVADIKRILTTTQQKIQNRDIDKEKELISNIREYRDKLLLSKRDPNTAKNKAKSLLKIISMCRDIEENNLSPSLISKIRFAIREESETLRIHRHACTLTPFLKVLCFFKPTMLEKRVDSIKLTANLDNYLNSVYETRRTLREQSKPKSAR